MENERFEAKKSLGQNFLTSQSALLKIVEAGDIKPSETVLEIGPGKGALTEKLLETGAKVVAVEKDDRLIPILTEKFGKNPNFSLIHGDILTLLESWGLAPETFPHNFAAQGFKIIANLPYYITGAFFEKSFSLEILPERIVVLLQKEVAERIVARDGKESILSQSIKAYGAPKHIASVPRGAFSPAPNVDSAVIQITQISKRLFLKHGVSENAYFSTLKRGFAHKRKLLSSNLDVSPEKLVSCGVAEKARAEELATEAWFCLAKNSNLGS